MTDRDFRVKLWEPDGKRYYWWVRFKTLKPIDGRTQYGRCRLDHREILINIRLRNPDTIRTTLLHEVGHVAVGELGSEFLIQAVEENFQDAVKRL